MCNRAHITILWQGTEGESTTPDKDAKLSTNRSGLLKKSACPDGAEIVASANNPVVFDECLADVIGIRVRSMY